MQPVLWHRASDDFNANFSFNRALDGYKALAGIVNRGHDPSALFVPEEQIPEPTGMLGVARSWGKVFHRYQEWNRIVSDIELDLISSLNGPQIQDPLVRERFTNYNAAARRLASGMRDRAWWKAVFSIILLSTGTLTLGGSLMASRIAVTVSVGIAFTAICAYLGIMSLVKEPRTFFAHEIARLHIAQV